MVRRRDAPTPPRIADPDLPDALEDVAGLARHDERFATRIASLSGDVDAAHARLVETVVAGATVGTWDLSGAQLTDVRVTEVRAAAVPARESVWRTVTVASGRLGTLDLLRAELDTVTFTGLRIDYLSLASARCRDVRFVRCELGALDLPGASLERVAFEDCRADEVDTRGLRGTDLDLRGLEALAFTDPAGLRGATLSERQVEFHARSFAAALGVRVL